jgi:hypothetical protein
VSFAWDNEEDVGKERHGAHAKDSYGAFTLDIKLVLNENLGDIRCHPMKSK